MKKDIGLILLILLMFLLGMAGKVRAADYYVSTTGNDTNTGLSEVQAWRTIQKAANSVNAGDTVHVLAGTYNEQVTISRSGTAGNPITFQGEGMPTITYTGSTPVVISGSYITVTGFKIIARDIIYDADYIIGIYVKYGSGATNLNISDNYIWTESGEGIQFDVNAGYNSIISNNEIHTGHKAGIGLYTMGSYSLENVTITNNTIYADENLQHRDWSDASGIWTYQPTGDVYYRNITVSYNKILSAGYTGIKMSGSEGTKVNYNEIGPNGFVHNAIEISCGECEYIGNRVHDTSLTWPTQVNSFYSPGEGLVWRKNLKFKDNVVENSYGRAWSMGGNEHHFIVENLNIKNHNGRGIEVGGVETSMYPWSVHVTGNGIFYNMSLNIFGPNAEYPIIIQSLGEATSSNHADWNAYKPADMTFIDTNITGNYPYQSWWITSQLPYPENHHFEGTIYIINSNKDDVVITKDSEGTFNGSAILYYYLDARVIDTDGNPIQGAKVSFTANDPAIKAKNTNYTYVPFPDGVTQNISYTFTGPDGHTPLPLDATNTVAIADFKQTITGKTYYTWTITAEKGGFTNSTTVNPDAAWYRLNPDTYQNTITITLPITGTLPIDINQDGVIDISDLRIVALHFGESTTLPYPRYDVNTDGTVDILDLRQVAGGM